MKSNATKHCDHWINVLINSTCASYEDDRIFILIAFDIDSQAYEISLWRYHNAFYNSKEVISGNGLVVTAMNLYGTCSVKGNVGDVYAKILLIW